VLRKKGLLLILVLVSLTLAACDFFTEDDETTFTIEFDALGGESVDAMNVTIDDIPDLPETTREGYHFEGWYLDEDYSEGFSPELLESDVTLYAKWQPATYTMTFETFDGESVDAITAEYGETLSASNSIVSFALLSGGEGACVFL